jgi:IS30 family transposase
MPYTHLSIEEREIIQRGLWEKRSVRSIAEGLGRSHTSIAREIQRARPPLMDRYTPRTAHTRALSFRKHRGRTKRLKNDAIRQYVSAHLKQRWSPEQCSKTSESPSPTKPSIDSSTRRLRMGMHGRDVKTFVRISDEDADNASRMVHGSISVWLHRGAFRLI